MPLGDRNFGKSFPNGSGICAWSWDNTALRPHFGPRPLLKRANPHPQADRRITTFPQKKNPHLRADRSWDMIFPRKRMLPMVHRNGHNPPLRMVSQAQRFFPNPMGRCFAHKGRCSSWSNAARSVRVPRGCPTSPIWMIAAPVPYVRSVKTVTPVGPDGSVQSIGLCLKRHPAPRLPHPLPVLPSCGAIGLAAPSDANG
jgi:hypothetical protein